MLKVSNITKSFGEKKVLSEVSFEIGKSSIVGLLGPNGAGKTTLMRTIVGFYSLKEGEIFWNKKSVDTKDDKYKGKIGYLPENNPLYLSMSPLEYLRFIASLKKIDKDLVDDEVKKVINECGLSGVATQKIETLSKGYKQRVGLAQAILGDPKLLILDEPTSGLDPNQILEIRALIKKLAKDKIILISTHILPEAKDVCGRILIINNGKIVLDEETKKIKNLEKKFVQLTS